jgi:general secretion pathway protein C
MTFASALLAGASVVYWVLGATGPQHAPAPAAQALAAPDAPGAKDLAMALGGKLIAPASVPVVPATQYQLLGVVAGAVGKGHALLVVGAAPPKAYTVGSALGEGMVLQSVSSRSAKIGASMQGPSTLELTLPKPQGW